MGRDERTGGRVSGTPQPIALSAPDEAILRLEGGLLVGHTCKVIALAAPAPSLDELRSRVAERLVTGSPLTMRLGTSGRVQAWVSSPDFDPAGRVVEAGGGLELDRPALRSEVARLFAERLDREQPLWRIDVVRLSGGGA